MVGQVLVCIKHVHHSLHSCQLGLLLYPTDNFTALLSQNPPVSELCVARKGRSTDFEVQKFWNLFSRVDNHPWLLWVWRYLMKEKFWFFFSNCKKESWYSTGPSAILELQNMSCVVCEINATRRSPDGKAPKLGEGRSGGTEGKSYIRPFFQKTS